MHTNPWPDRSKSQIRVLEAVAWGSVQPLAAELLGALKGLFSSHGAAAVPCSHLAPLQAHFLCCCSLVHILEKVKDSPHVAGSLSVC